MNARASAIEGKKLSGERIANLKKMSECPALGLAVGFKNRHPHTGGISVATSGLALQHMDTSQ